MSAFAPNAIAGRQAALGGFLNAHCRALRSAAKGMALAALVVTGGIDIAVRAHGAQPQPGEAAIVVNPKEVAFEHDGIAVDGYALYATSEQETTVRVDLGRLRPSSGGQVRARLPRLSAGVYTIELAAYNSVGESPRIQASPGRVRITGATDRLVESNRNAHKDPHEDEPPRQTSGSQGGFLQWLWRFIVGSD